MSFLSIIDHWPSIQKFPGGAILDFQKGFQIPIHFQYFQKLKTLDTLHCFYYIHSLLNNIRLNINIQLHYHTKKTTVNHDNTSWAYWEHMVSYVLSLPLCRSNSRLPNRSKPASVTAHPRPWPPRPLLAMPRPLDSSLRSSILSVL